MSEATPRKLETRLTRDAGIEIPLICGAMYPCSNPELVGAASAAGAIGIVQPISLQYVFGHDLREGLRLIDRLAGGRPVGFNVIVEKSAKAYEDRMRRWVDVALEEGVRFFITALGKPDWVVRRVQSVGGKVYHDVTDLRWAEKALEHGVDGLICVNARAGGHAGSQEPRALYEELADLGAPLVCAGGVGDAATYTEMLEIGYAGCQLGTRFIATRECSVHDDYKAAILGADAEDIVLTDKLSGVPCSVINTPHVERVGLRAGPIARRLLRGRRTKHWMRTIYSLRALWQLKRSSLRGISYKDYFQAGKSVAGVHEVESVAEVVSEYADAARRRFSAA